MSNWWGNKLGTPAPPRQGNYPPSAAPRGFQPPPPVGAPQEQRYQESPPEDNGLKPGEMTAGQAMREWKGTAAAQNTGNCPHCNSPRYFERRTGGVTTSNGVVYPKGECFECGYPNEQGQLGSDVSQVIGGASSARQGDMLPMNMIPGKSAQ